MSAEKELTDATFDQDVANGVALVDFWAPWCGPCRMQGPILEKVAKKYAGKATVGKLEVDNNPNTAARFGVQSIPTLIILKNGKEVGRFVGVQDEAALSRALDQHLA